MKHLSPILLCLFCWVAEISHAQQSVVTNPVALFKFDGNNKAGPALEGTVTGDLSFVKGLDGKALAVRSTGAEEYLSLNTSNLPFDAKKDFSVQFWVKTTMDAKKPAVLLSQKVFPNNSLASQKNAGWVIYSYGGTWAWSIGSGKRRVTHERDNGQIDPLNDGKWHQLTMTYNSANSEIRLYYDGRNKALYNVSDSVGFDFTNNNPLIVGAAMAKQELENGILAEITKGAASLQQLVDEYNRLGAGQLAPDELESLVVDGKGFFTHKVNQLKSSKGADSTSFAEAMKAADLKAFNKARSDLSRNAYTIFQVRDFMDVAPLLKLYSLVNGKIVINQAVAQTFTEGEQLYRPDFDMDNLAIWDRTLAPSDVLSSYAKFFKTVVPALPEHLTALTTGDWNIHHGGKHNTIEKDGWDSRQRIAEMLKKQNADVIMMQETYSSGDYIAAELGYYFATTVDWDYLNQGANISVLSRYPIKELYVPKGAPFMDVAVKVSISKTQDVYVMANWYGMDKFPQVYSFHEGRFAQSDSIPVLFAGDFNAVPHTDGGNSPASRKMLSSGFTDAYRSLYPDIAKYPGYTHESDHRIDQLYYKGKGLKNTSTRIITSWPGGFPSDHFLNVSTFDLNYSTRK